MRTMALTLLIAAVLLAIMPATAQITRSLTEKSDEYRIDSFADNDQWLELEMNGRDGGNRQFYLIRKDAITSMWIDYPNVVNIDMGEGRSFRFTLDNRDSALELVRDIARETR